MKLVIADMSENDNGIPADEFFLADGAFFVVFAQVHVQVLRGRGWGCGGAGASVEYRFDFPEETFVATLVHLTLQ